MVGTVEKEILDIQDDSVIKIRQKLFPEEEKMNLAKYFYNYPLHYPSPIEMQIINTMNPMPVEEAIKPENFMSLLKPYGYDRYELGYCMFPDGSGFYIEYSVTPPTWNGKWRRWYGN